MSTSTNTSTSTSSTDTVTEAAQTDTEPASLPAYDYYDDEDRLTCDEAEILVERYFRQDVCRSVTRVKHVLTAFDKPYTSHNHHRVMIALRDRCEKHNPERTGPTRFTIPEEYR